MFLEYWMIGLFMGLATYFMSKLYKEGYDKGAKEFMVMNIDTTLAILKEKKIIDIVDDENGEPKIIPGDYDAFIKEAEKRKS